ncbi:hypothetical protein V3C99_016792 [Haemonchus contortus]
MAWDVCTYAMTARASGASAAISSKFAFGHYVMEKDFVMFSVTAGIFALSNVLMWWAYTKSLSLAESSIQCLAINMGTNFALTVSFVVLFSNRKVEVVVLLSFVRSDPAQFTKTILFFSFVFKGYCGCQVSERGTLLAQRLLRPVLQKGSSKNKGQQKDSVCKGVEHIAQEIEAKPVLFLFP